MPRLRFPLRPWTRAYSSLPSSLQRELFRSVAQPVAVLSAFIPQPSLSSSSPSSATESAADKSGEPREAPQHHHGATLSSLASVSLSPPLVSFSLRLPSRFASHLSQPPPAPPPTFRVHLLSAAQEGVARAFARQAPLPALASPSPPPPSAAIATQGWDDPFPPELFEELERDGLGWMDCTVVKRVALSELKGGGENGDEGGKAPEKGAWQPRSELFIARVDKVKLGEALKGKEGKGSLVYWEQAYHAVPGKGNEGQ
ncbi:hypothetical protein JCM8547_003396 [Rhodosporidiobolus lusitaniae]